MVSCNLQLIQSQNEEFLLAKVFKFPIPRILGSGRLREGCSMLVSFEKDQEEERGFLLRKTALRPAAATEDTPVFPTVQLPSPQTAGR